MGRETGFDRLDLHFHSPSKRPILHSDMFQCRSADGAKWPEIGKRAAPDPAHQVAGKPVAEALWQRKRSGVGISAHP